MARSNLKISTRELKSGTKVTVTILDENALTVNERKTIDMYAKNGATIRYKESGLTADKMEKHLKKLADEKTIDKKVLDEFYRRRERKENFMITQKWYYEVVKKADSKAQEIE